MSKVLVDKIELSELLDYVHKAEKKEYITRINIVVKNLSKQIRANENFIVDIWNAEDVISCAVDNGYIKPSKKKAMEILKFTVDNSDASIGINWNTILSSMECLGLKERKTKE